MNAAFLLVATAFVAGSDPVQAAPAQVATPIVSSGCGCSTCDTCNTCNTCEGKHFFGGFRGLFAKKDCGCDSCGSKHLFSGLGKSCGCGGGFSLGLKERFSHKCDTCNECAQEKSCGCGIMESPLSRLGGLFRKKSCGCSTCDTCNTCSTCGGGGTVIQGAPPVAPIPAQPGIKAAPVPAAPQKMPAAPPAKPVSTLTPTGGLIIE